MKAPTAAEAAHLRLLSAIPREAVRTHRYVEPPRPGVNGKQRVIKGVGKGGANRVSIICGGRTFKSMLEAKNQLGVGHFTLKAMLADGRARRA